MSEPQFSNTDLNQCRQQLEAWRLTRPPGAVLPQTLWRAAVWTFQKRLSSGRFWAWPKAQAGAAFARELLAPRPGLDRRRLWIKESWAHPFIKNRGPKPLSQ